MPKVKKRGRVTAVKRGRKRTEPSSEVGDSSCKSTTHDDPSSSSMGPDNPPSSLPHLPSPPSSTMQPPCSKVVAQLIASFRQLLTSHTATHPECAKYAPVISKYMRNKFTFLGLKAPARRALQKQFLEEHGASLQDRSTLIEFVRCLWTQDERDFQGFGTDLLAQYRDTLLGASEGDFQTAVGVVEHCVVTKSWWDTVDMIAYPVFGYFVKQRPALGLPVVWQWIDHDNMWLRRVAILHQLSQKKNTDEDLLFQLCLKQAHETEFFIRKAIGWALRDYSWTNKKAVKGFVEKNKTSFSTLSIREALKHC